MEKDVDVTESVKLERSEARDLIPHDSLVMNTMPTLERPGFTTYYCIFLFVLITFVNLTI